MRGPGPLTTGETDGAGPAERDLAVAIVEDDLGYRESMRRLIEGAAGLRFAGGFDSAEDAVERMRGPLDVLLLDIRLPGERGSRAVGRFLERFPGLVVVMLTLFDEDDEVFEALCSGATGYLLKKTPPRRILEALREAYDGGAPMSPKVARKVVTLFRTFPIPPRGPVEGLTPRELGLLSLLARGHTYQAAAGEMDVSINTVRKHVRSVYEKLQVHCRSEAVAKALRSGLI